MTKPTRPAAATSTQPAASPNEVATQASTAAFRGMLALFGAVVDELPPAKACALADALAAGARVTAAVVLPLGGGCPDVTFELLLPDGRSIALASVNVGGAARAH